MPTVSSSVRKATRAIRARKGTQVLRVLWGAAGRGISSFAKTGVEAASVTSPAQVSDIWRMQYDDRTGVNVKIPRGARWFTCAALEALADSETVANYAVGAVMGDYLLSTVTGNVWRKAADTGNLWNAIGCIQRGSGCER